MRGPNHLPVTETVSALETHFEPVAQEKGKTDAVPAEDFGTGHSGGCGRLRPSATLQVCDGGTAQAKWLQGHMYANLNLI